MYFLHIKIVIFPLPWSWPLKFSPLSWSGRIKGITEFLPPRHSTTWKKNTIGWWFWILGRHFVSQLSQVFSWRGDFFFGRKPGKNVQISVPIQSMYIWYIYLYAKKLIVKNVFPFLGGGNFRNISFRSFLLNDRKQSKSSPLVVHKQSWT